MVLCDHVHVQKLYREDKLYCISDFDAKIVSIMHNHCTLLMCTFL